MTPMGPRLRLRLVAVLLVALSLGAAVDGWRWSQKQATNAKIAEGIPTRPTPTSRPELRFAHASGLASRNEREAAIDAYRLLQDDTPLGVAARYNAANQLLLQALELRNSPLPGQALPLLELAKAGYREVLRVDPTHWDARYNLERAQRLQPDPEDVEADPAGPPENAERAATTMRGTSRGLP
jgi:mxaK protein